MTLEEFNQALDRFRDEMALAYRKDVPILPEAPLLSKFANSLNREVREGHANGFDAARPMIEMLRKALAEIGHESQPMYWHTEATHKRMNGEIARKARQALEKLDAIMGIK